MIFWQFRTNIVSLKYFMKNHLTQLVVYQLNQDFQLLLQDAFTEK